MSQSNDLLSHLLEEPNSDFNVRASGREKARKSGNIRTISGEYGSKRIQLFSNDTVVAALQITPPFGDKQTISGIYTYPDYRNQGLATELLKVAEKRNKITAPAIDNRTDDGKAFFAKYYNKPTADNEFLSKIINATSPFPSGAKLVSGSELDNGMITSKHVAPSEEAVISILSNGFNFKKCGDSARQFGLPESYIINSPVGIYSSPVKDLYLPKGHAFIEFKLKPDSSVLTYDEPASEFKLKLREHLGAKNEVEFAAKLKNMGVDAIVDKHGTDETIILNPKCADILSAGLEGEKPIPTSKKVTHTLKV